MSAIQQHCRREFNRLNAKISHNFNDKIFRILVVLIRNDIRLTFKDRIPHP